MKVQEPPKNMVWMFGAAGHRFGVAYAEPDFGLAWCECGHWSVEYPRRRDRVSITTARAVLRSHATHVQRACK